MQYWKVSHSVRRTHTVSDCSMQYWKLFFAALEGFACCQKVPHHLEVSIEC